MRRAFWPVFNTILFTIFVPGTVAVLIPLWLVGDVRWHANAPATWMGAVTTMTGAAIYLRGAWEFAVNGLGTPARSLPQSFW